ELQLANQRTLELPEPVLFREFGDGSTDQLARRYEDQYTEIIWPERYRRFQQQVDGSFVGVGILIRHDDKRDIVVVNPLEGSPAWRGGVKPEDRIVEVDGSSTVGWSTNRAVDEITGPAGRPVTLTLRREGAEEPVDI
ncbi:MAG: S41 family peptidase, partial [Phycisphaerales bacterium]